MRIEYENKFRDLVSLRPFAGPDLSPCTSRRTVPTLFPSALLRHVRTPSGSYIVFAPRYLGAAQRRDNDWFSHWTHMQRRRDAED